MLNRYIRGIGLLELMLSLAVVALVMVMAARYFTVVRQQQKITQTIQMGSDLLKATYAWGARQVSFPYGRVFNNDLVKDGFLPSDYCADPEPGTLCEKGGTWPFGKITVEGRESTPGVAQHLAFKVYGLSKDPSICQIVRDGILKNVGKGNGEITDFLCP